MRTRFGWVALTVLLIAGCGSPPQTAPSPTGVAAPAERQVLNHNEDDDDRYRDYDDIFANRDWRDHFDDDDFDHDDDDDDDDDDEDEVRVVAAYSSSNYKDTRPRHAIDNNTDTQWANDGYQREHGWLAVEFARDEDIDDVRIKTGVLGSGVRYRLEVSNSGRNWEPVTDWLRGDSWELERVRVDDHGRFLRVFFDNSERDPAPRFSVFELEVLQEDRFGRDRDRRDRDNRVYGYDFDFLY